MRPRLRSQLLIGMVITLALAGSVIGELREAKIYNQSKPTKAEGRNSPASESPGNAASKPQQPEAKQKDNWYDIFVNHPTDWLLVLFNGILALYTRRLFQATSGLSSETAGLRSTADQQAIDMKQSIQAAAASAKAAADSAAAAVTSNQIAVTNAETELRAYVTASDVDGITHRGVGSMGAYGNNLPGKIHTYEFAIVLKNGGKTPAINVRTNISLKRFEGEAPADFDFPSSELFGFGLIGPQMEWRTRYQAVSAGLVEDIGPTMLLWGWVEYDDIFTASGSTPRHRTEFCYRIDRRRLPVTNDFWMGFIPHNRFNAAEGDCLRPIDPATGKGGG